MYGQKQRQPRGLDSGKNGSKHAASITDTWVFQSGAGLVHVPIQHQQPRQNTNNPKKQGMSSDHQSTESQSQLQETPNRANLEQAMQYLVHTFEITPSNCEALLPSQYEDESKPVTKLPTKKFVSSH